MGPTSKGKEGRGREGSKRRRRKGRKGREGKERDKGRGVEGEGDDIARLDL